MDLPFAFIPARATRLATQPANLLLKITPLACWTLFDAVKGPAFKVNSVQPVIMLIALVLPRMHVVDGRRLDCGGGLQSVWDALWVYLAGWQGCPSFGPSFMEITERTG